MTNRYLIFAGDTYYARGGANDFIGSESNCRAARKRARRLIKTVRNVKYISITIDWSHILDTHRKDYWCFWD